jgi:hypothetical protein
MNSKIKFDPEDGILTDGLSRTVHAIYDEPIYSKRVEFKTPNYAIPLTVSANIDVRNMRLEIDHLLSDHTKFYVSKIFDVDNVILNKVDEMKQQTIDGKSSNPVFQKFFFSNAMILDFMPESLDYIKNLNRYSYTKRLPKEVSTLAGDLVAHHDTLGKAFEQYKEKEIEKFWEPILTNIKTLNKFEGQIFDQGVSVYGDIITPFTKVIKNKTDLLDVKKINDVWITLNRINNKPTVAYILLSPIVLRNEYLIVEIIEYIKNLKVDILLFKVKNLELTDGSKHVRPRENMMEILKSIAEKKQKEEILTIALECSEQLYPFSLQAFDIVSTSASMYDKETTGGGGLSDSGAGYGKALDEESLALLDYDIWEREFNKIGSFPCSHDFCKNRITTMDKSVYQNNEWWIDSRIHNILAINEWNRIVSESVVNHQAGLAFNRLANSPLKVLTELLTPNYNTPNF